MRYLPFLESLHVLNNVKLLPAFREVDGALWQQVIVSNVNKRKVLQHQASETRAHCIFLLLTRIRSTVLLRQSFRHTTGTL